MAFKRKAKRSSDYVRLSLRIREGLRAKLAKAAAQGKTSITAEIVARVERSFEADQVLDIAAVVADLKAARDPLEEMVKWFTKMERAGLGDVATITRTFPEADWAGLARELLRDPAQSDAAPVPDAEETNQSKS
jgi:hypothetical protein